MAIGAYAVERDHSHYVANASRTVLAVVGTASKGPVGEATVVTSAADLVNKFGPLKVDCFGLYAAQYFLSQSSKLYFVRAASASAKSATAAIQGSKSSGDAIDAITIEVIDKGTYYEGSKLTITEAADDSYDLVLKNSTGGTIESLKGIKVSDLVVDFQTKYIKVTNVVEGIVSLVAGTYTLEGGDDGILDIVAGDYNLALDKLSAEQLDFNLLAVPGVTDPEVIVKGIAIAEYRGDCLYLVDPPKGLDRDEVIQWSETEGEFTHTKYNSSYATTYYDWVEIYDSVNKVNVQVPPSVVAVATYAYSDRISELWYAPAGLTRGVIKGVVRPITRLSRADVELLYEHNINSIYEDPEVGLVLWGQKTLSREATALDRVNVRRLMNYLKKVIVAACNHLVFEPNDRVTWNSFEMKVLPTLDNIKNRRGIYEYKVVKGESIVTAEDIDNYRMPCMIIIKPTKAAEEIPIYFSITSTGADFNEVLEANGVVN